MFNPRERSQPIALLACLFVVYSLICGRASAAPSITLSKKSGPPTSRILVSGRGFKPNVGVDIFFDTKDKALVVSNGKGEFHDAGIHAPRSAYPGKHWVTALERNNDKGAQQPFLVQTNWSQFHFDADGTRLHPYENVLNPHTASGIGLKWSYTTGSDVASSPAVTNGLVYFGAGDYNVYALDAGTGAKVWSYTTGSFIASSPAVANGIVYVGSWDGNVYALDARTGAKVWSYPAGGTSSPAVANGIIYVGSSDSNVYALNASGDELWSYTTGDQVRSSPAVVNGVVYIGSWDDNVYALNANSGAKLWSYTTGNAVYSSPAVANGVVYVCSNDGNLYALNANSGALLWSYANGNTPGSTPAVANGVVYFASVSFAGGSVSALDASTGALLWSYSGPRFGDSSPAVANGVVYVGADNGNLYALNARSGALISTYATGADVQSSPSVANGVVYLGSDDGRVYALGLARGEAAERVASDRPDLKTLRPDFSLKVSKRSHRLRVRNSEVRGDNCRNQAIK